MLMDIEYSNYTLHDHSVSRSERHIFLQVYMRDHQALVTSCPLLCANTGNCLMYDYYQPNNYNYNNYTASPTNYLINN